MSATKAPIRVATSLTLLAATAAAATAFLAPTAAAGTAEPASSAAAIGVQSLVDAPAPTIPEDFAAVMGYTPSVEDGILVDPSGDCSSPVTLPNEFDNACKGHDLGYDMLRYADRTGDPLGGWARQELDDQLRRRMHDACSSRQDAPARVGCYAMAEIAAGFVDINSWRQGYRSPAPEHAEKYVVAAVLGTAALVGAGAIALGRRLESAGITASGAAVQA